ncbi:MAG: NTP transferase domain-containing protein [Alphaproteobacteria bacterium]|nr:NTP transferase domain-containing protein [Alphaproteobacteria bacterium]
MTTAIIAQARAGSRRLPGKVLRPLAGMPAMVQTLRRARAIVGGDVVVLATSTEPADDVVADTAAAAGVEVFRGSQDDVLDRVLGAARKVDANIVMRLTCDCPLLDPEVCAAVLDLRAAEETAYASNVERPEWPHGLDCEAVTRDLLEQTAAATTDRQDREHVTLWIRRNGEIDRSHLAGPGGNARAQRWVLDHADDLTFLEALFEQLPPVPHIPGWREVLRTVEDHPEIAKINRHLVTPERRA